MKNLQNSLRRFLANKNTVTIFCTVAAILVLYVGYSMRIKSATSPVRIPYAKVDIQPRTLITESMVGFMDVPNSMISTNVVRVPSEIYGKYSNYNTLIPQGSMFYRSTLAEWKDMPDSAFADIPDGYTIVSLAVNYDSTFGNSIFPGNYIDLYFKSTENGRVLFGKFIESIKVLAVKDDEGRNVFENSENLGDPAALLFSVPEDLHLLLRKAVFVDAEIIPVPRNASYCADGNCDTEVSSEYIKNFVIAQTVIIPDEKLPDINGGNMINGGNNSNNDDEDTYQEENNNDDNNNDLTE